MRALSLMIALAAAGCGDWGLHPNTEPTAATHAQYFPIDSGPHAVDCNTCHGAFDSFKQFDCLTGCHAQTDTDPIHGGLPGYAYMSASCYTCHPKGVADGGVDHTKIFPIATGDLHANIPCGTCHADAADRTDVTCANDTCHAQSINDPAHGNVGGYQWTPPLCKRCHADSQVDAVAAHAPFKIASGAPHFLQPCLSCHPSFRTDKIFGADFTQFSCTDGCHAQSDTDPQHSGVSGYSYGQCSLCHPSGSAADSVDHVQFFPIATGDQHNGVGCQTCHADPNNRDSVSCTTSTCHLQSDIGTTHSKVRDDHTLSSECLACHADSQVNPIASHPGNPGASHEHANCSTGKGCHKAFRTDKPFGLDFSLYDCSSCHDTPTGPSGGG